MAQTTIFDLLKNFLKDDTWFFTELPGGDTLRLGFEGENGQWSCYAMVREEQSQLIFYSYCPVKIPEGKRNVVAEYLTRANLGLVIGNFELDFNDGSIRFKTSSFIPPEEMNLPGGLFTR